MGHDLVAGITHPNYYDEMFLLLLTVALAAAANASPAIRHRPMPPNGRIVGGEDAEIETYPYQIGLELDGRYFCGGSIISKNYVLTAAHCTDGQPSSRLTVRAGATNVSDGGSVHHVVKLIPHEQFGLNELGIPSNDIALIEVKEPFQFDDTRQPIKLYEKAEESVPGAASVITGWGYTELGLPSQLQSTTIPIIDKKECNNAYYYLGGLTEGQICAALYGVGGRDSCSGDSGGPLAIDGRLAGVVSWGAGCGDPYSPGVYTEVAHYHDWVNQHAQL